MLDVQTKAPEFHLVDQDNKEHTLSDFLGHYVVLYFYPKDDTPGCTTEACTIRDNYELFQKKAIVIGVSSDSVKSHKKFAEKYQLPFILLSDPQREMIKAYHAGNIFTKRITYLIDPRGMIIRSYAKVIPTQHASELLDDLKDLTKIS